MVFFYFRVYTYIHWNIFVVIFIYLFFVCIYIYTYIYWKIYAVLVWLKRIQVKNSFELSRQVIAMSLWQLLYSYMYVSVYVHVCMYVYICLLCIYRYSYLQLYFPWWRQRISLCRYVHVRDTFLKYETACATTPWNSKSLCPLQRNGREWICRIQPHCIRCRESKLYFAMCFHIYVHVIILHTFVYIILSKLLWQTANA